MTNCRFRCYPGVCDKRGRTSLDARREEWSAKGFLLEGGRRHELSVDQVRFPEAMSARKHDRIRLDDMRRFEIVEVRPTGMTHIVFGLVELRR